MTLTDAVVVFLTLYVISLFWRSRRSLATPSECEWHQWSYVEGLYTCGTCGKVAENETDDS